MKALNLMRNLFVWAVAVIAIGMMVFTIVSVTTFGQADRSLFGYKSFIILSDSMSATDFDAGDLVLVKETDPSMLEAGDIIAFTSQNDASYGETVTHKIRTVTTTEDGQPAFVTYGTTTDTDDEAVVTYPYVIGKYTTHLADVGAFFQFLKTVPGYFVCIFTPFMILIACEAVRCVRLFRKYRAEREAEMQAEREKIRAEYAETQRMLREIAAMKAQMADAMQPLVAEEGSGANPNML